MGQRGNREATTMQCMFLPDYLMTGLTTAQYQNQLIAAPRVTLYNAPKVSIQHSWYSSPLFVYTIAVLLLIGSFILFKSRTWLNSWTLLLFIFSGVVGCLIVFLGGFTAHPITAPNWNILWANPFNALGFSVFYLQQFASTEQIKEITS